MLCDLPSTVLEVLFSYLSPADLYILDCIVSSNSLIAICLRAYRIVHAGRVHLDLTTFYMGLELRQAHRSFPPRRFSDVVRGISFDRAVWEWLRDTIAPAVSRITISEPPLESLLSDPPFDLNFRQRNEEIRIYLTRMSAPNRYERQFFPCLKHIHILHSGMPLAGRLVLQLRRNPCWHSPPVLETFQCLVYPERLGIGPLPSQAVEALRWIIWRHRASLRITEVKADNLTSRLLRVQLILVGATLL